MNLPIPPQPTLKQPLTEAHIQMDSRSEEYLLMIASGKCSRGKVVIAKVDDKVLLGVGATSSFHSIIISDTARQLLQREVATDRHPDSARPLPGIVVEGAHFRFDRTTATLTIFDRSLTFGGFRTMVFAEPTEVVVGRFLKDRLSRCAGLPLAPTESLGDFPPSLRQITLHEPGSHNATD